MNVLLTSVGRRAYLVDYFKKEFGDNSKIICTNSSELSTALSVGDKSYISPMIYEETYIPFLLEICKKEKINILVSLFDIDLPILAYNKDKFENLGVKLILSDLFIIEVCNDKYKMNKFLKNNFFDTVYTGLSIEDEYIKNNISSEKKFILKPRWGMGSLGIYISDEYEEAKYFYKKIRKDIDKSYLRYEAKQDIENSILIQELIEGKEYGLDIVNDLEGNYITTVVKEKLAMRSGETDIAKIVHFPLLEDFGKRIADKTGHIANMDLDLILNDKGIFVIDMNARFGGGYPFTHKAGVNIVKIIKELLEGKTIDKNTLVPTINKIYAKDINIVEI